MDNFDLWELAVKPIDDNINHYSINLFGTDGSGKTSFMNTLMNKLGRSFTLGFEDRFKSVVNIKVLQFQNWNEFLTFKKKTKSKIKKEGCALPFDSAVFDTIGEAAKMCKEHIMKENGWDELQGDQYNVVGNACVEEVRDLRNMGFVVNFVSHDKPRELTSATGGKYNQTVPDTINQIKHLVLGDCDFILYLEIVNDTDENGNKREYRRLWIHGHPMLKLKTALYGMPEYIDYTDVNEGADKFLEAFKEGVRVTQKMQDDGKDIGNPNADNNKLPKKEEIETGITDEEDEDEIQEELGKIIEDEAEIPSVVTPKEEPTLSIEELREKAINVRKKLREKLGNDETKNILTEMLGSNKLKEYEDSEKLKAFVEKYK